MSIQSEITRISGNVSDALTAIEAKGVTIPSGANSDDLATLIGQISAGGGSGIVITDTADAAGGTVRTITAVEISGTKTITQNGISDVTEYAAVNVNVSGGGGGATQHVIHLEFSDSTDTDINVYYDDALLASMITAYTPTTYGGKTVTLAQLDGTTWYEPANIPLNTQLIDYTSVSANTTIGSNGSAEPLEWYYASDYTEVEPGMTFSYTAGIWTNIGLYDSSKNVLSVISVYGDGTADPGDSNTAHGTLSGNKLPSGVAYVRIAGTWYDSAHMSLIRTA